MDHSGQHAHVVSGDTVHVSRLFSDAAKEVAAAHHDGNLDSQGMHIGDLSSDAVYPVYIDTKALARRQGLSRQLQENAFKDSGHCVFSIERAELALIIGLERQTNSKC